VQVENEEVAPHVQGALHGKRGHPDPRQTLGISLPPQE
jgi:hypothetical protein